MALYEFLYLRHGTTSLIAFLNIADGTVDETYLNQTRTEVDFCAAVKNLLENETAKKYIAICDGLNTHKSEGLVTLAAQERGLTIDLGIKAKTGILKNKGSRKAFLTEENDRIHQLIISIIHYIILPSCISLFSTIISMLQAD